MVINWTQGRVTVSTITPNAFGYYGIPYPNGSASELSEATTVELSNYSYQGLTLARMKALDSDSDARLVWVPLAQQR